MHSTQTQKEIAIRDTERKKQKKNRKKGSDCKPKTEKGEAAIGNRKALEVKKGNRKGLCPSGRSTTIKEEISTSIVCPIIVVSPENVLVPYRTHCLVIDVQPSFSTSIAATAPRAAITVRVEHIKRIVSAACRHAMVVEHPIERVARGLRGGSGSRCHNI